MLIIRREFLAIIGLWVLSACSDNILVPEPMSTDSSQPVPGNAATSSDSGGTIASINAGVIAGTSGELRLTFAWQAQIVVEPDPGFVTTTTYERHTSLVCPVSAGSVTAGRYFAALEGLDPTQPVPGGAFQPWWNEGCTGEMVINDTYHSNDPTLAGPEPVVHTTGSKPVDTSSAPLIIETDVNKNQTRYFFPTPFAEGFQQEEGYGRQAQLVAANAMPDNIDLTVPGVLAASRQEIAVAGGVVVVEWDVVLVP